MKRFQFVLIILLPLSFYSCSTIKSSSGERKTTYQLQAGFNYGGITENTDMEVVPGVSVPSEATVDAFTGATRTGYNGGFHMVFPTKHNHIETGFDYMINFQEFNYIDAGNFYIGVRRLNVSQFMIPLTYNFNLFHKYLPKTDLVLKFGFLGQINNISCKDSGIQLPSYTTKTWSSGLTMGVSGNLINFSNGSKLGMYLDLYRGSQVYLDHYNQESFEMPGTSFFKAGFMYQF